KGNVVHSHRIKSCNPVQGLIITAQKRPYYFLNPLGFQMSPVRIAQHNYRKFQPFRLVDGQEGYAPFRENILSILIFSLTPAEESTQKGNKEDTYKFTVRK